MFTPTRDETRRFLINAWEKRRQRQPLSPLEHLAADIIAMHPEYHCLLTAGSQAVARDWPPEQGQTNPFLHLSLHLAVEEQLSIDQPPGIRTALGLLEQRHGDHHAALHAAIECLAEILWAASCNQAPPDSAAYLDCLRRRS